MKFLGSVLLYIGLYFVYAMNIHDRDSFTIAKFAFSMILALPLLFLSQFLLGKHQDKVQVEKESEARDIIDRAKAVDFFLYLRPFNTTNAFKVKSTHRNFFSIDLWESDKFDDIERLVSDALSPTATLVALGKPGEHRGAARYLTSESTWREKASSLIQDSRLIVAIPSSNPGTLWELEQLTLHRHLFKTIFVMPPSSDLFYSSSINMSSEWGKALEATKAFGMELPEHFADGAIFTLRLDGKDAISLAFLASLPPPEPGAWYKALQRAIDALS